MVAATEASVCGGHEMDQLDPHAKNGTKGQEGDELELLTAAEVGENGRRKLAQPVA